MEHIYQYEANEDILSAKYIFYRDPVSVLQVSYERHWYL